MDEVDLALELVRINSENPPGREKEAGKFIHDYLDDLKIDSELMEFEEGRANVVASIGKSDGLMLNGHIDTVPVGDVDSWGHNPFGEISGEKIYGRGTSDMKGGVAAILAALRKIDFSKVKRKLLLVFVADEEAKLGGSTWLLENRKGLLQDVKYGVIAEPTDMKIQIAQKGIVDIKVKFKGKSSHGSMPWLGENAVVKASKFVTELEKLNDRMKIKDGLLGKGSINVGKISGGVKVNVVPDYCEIEIDRRLVPGETSQLAVGELKGILEKLKLNAEIEMVVTRPPFRIDKNSKIVKLVRDLARTETFGATGYTEAELYKSKADVECVVFGPGNKETIHTAKEYISISNLKRATNIFEKLIRTWCL